MVLSDPFELKICLTRQQRAGFLQCLQVGLEYGLSQLMSRQVPTLGLGGTSGIRLDIISETPDKMDFGLEEAKIIFPNLFDGLILITIYQEIVQAVL
ncbi:hypothetical protein O9G_001372 [Rozella allomycis CSF55]|uniref:Uncharacterized protein n=1 Tax=Rozella allomycis (strain CSF55) TaxID=988480 RepID=A0A075B3H4_ROZAC|nr:hypothetical protein O9G_001372 [Rozella allomycis CSF55]|eukprot:EPZ36927.1 hypothetical protein O9G_001372 [Rozella allomycis CSF55]